MDIVVLMLVLIIGYLVFKLLIVQQQLKKERKEFSNAENNTKSTKILKHILKAAYEKEGLSKTLNRLISILIDEFNLSYVTFVIADEDKLNIAASNVYGKASLKRILSFIEKIKIKGIGGKQFIKDSGYLDYAIDRKVNFAFYIPLKYDDKILGGLLIEKSDATSEELNESNIDIFKVIVDSVMLSFQNLIFYDKLVTAAKTDKLTGLGNRREMEDIIDDAIEKNIEFSITMLDIDLFKKFNDEYGHAFGDKVLVTVSNYIKENIPLGSFIFRYGGEEFIIFMPLNREEASKVLEKLRKGIENVQVTLNGTTTGVTCSFGVTDNSISNSFEILKEEADQALYQSKEQGRNKVSVYR